MMTRLLAWTLGTVLFCGMGWLFFRAIRWVPVRLGGGVDGEGVPGDALLRNYLAGLLGFWLLVLALRQLAPAMWVAGILGTIGGVGWMRTAMRRGPATPAGEGNLFPILARWSTWVFLFLSGLFLFLIMATSLDAWDARSIWFFHGKMIHVAGGLQAPWTDAGISWSHPDYPKGMPILAATVSRFGPEWGDGLAKTSLGFLFLPMAYWLFLMRERSLRFVLLCMGLLVVVGDRLWNGYMDGYLALFGLFSLHSFGRALDQGGRTPLLLAGLGLGTVLMLKNEGQLIALVIVLSLGAVWILHRIRPRAEDRRPWFPMDHWLSLLLVVVLALTPILLWKWELHHLRIQHALNPLGAEAWHLWWQRLRGGASGMIWGGMFRQLTVPLLVLLTVFGFGLIRKFPQTRAAGLGLLVAGIYFVAMGFIYHTTPHDLTWHLRESVDRTMLPVQAFLFLSAFSAMAAPPDENQAKPHVG